MVFPKAVLVVVEAVELLRKTLLTVEQGREKVEQVAYCFQLPRLSVVAWF